MGLGIGSVQRGCNDFRLFGVPDTRWYIHRQGNCQRLPLVGSFRCGNHHRTPGSYHRAEGRPPWKRWRRAFSLHGSCGDLLGADVLRRAAGTPGTAWGFALRYRPARCGKYFLRVRLGELQRDVEPPVNEGQHGPNFGPWMGFGLRRWNCSAPYSVRWID